MKTRVLKVAETLLSRISEEDRNGWARRTVLEVLDAGVPSAAAGLQTGKRVSFIVSGALLETLSAAAEATGRSPNEIFSTCLAAAVGVEAPERAAVAALELAVAVAPAEPRVERVVEVPVRVERRQPPSKAAAKWDEARQQRLAIVRADAACGRWATFCITGGNPAIKPYEDLDAQGVRDFADEIEQGVVVQELIPWEYSHEEGQEWIRKQQAAGKALSWFYVSGDSESLNDAQEARRRSAMLADKRFAGDIEALAQVQREEQLERAVFGRKRYYIDWAKRDLELLAASGATQLPANLLKIAATVDNLPKLGRPGDVKYIGSNP